MKEQSPIIMNISTMDDIKKIEKNPDAKYINLDITTPNLEVIYYLLENGKKYSYSDMIEEKKNYIYVSYEIFKKSTLFILNIIKNVPTNLTEIEKARYLYITIGKNMGYDINILPDKNETFNLQLINTINNIWGAIENQKGTNVTFAKIYLYLCRIMNIDCKLISVSKQGYLKNEIKIKNRKLITDITQDIPFIQAGLKTKNFLGYNDNLEIDKKIGYIIDNYNDTKVEKNLQKIDYNNDLLEQVLLKTQNIINVFNIKPIELGIIYESIFNKYIPNQNIKINNLFVNNNYTNKEHFILISNGESYYSYNYVKRSFIRVSYNEVMKNIELKKIGIYLNEEIPNIINKEKVI